MIFHGQWNPPVDEVLLRNYFEDKNSGLCAECGAADGFSFTCCKHFEDKGWECINIEANKNHFPKLIVNRPKSINIEGALSENEGKAFFRNDSVVKLTNDQEIPPSEMYVVKTVSYRTVLEKVQFRQIDLFCLDVEGHEPLVLKGMVNSGLPLPKVFCIEYDHCGIDAIAAILKDKYRQDGVSFNNVFFSLPDQIVRVPFWGRTEEARQENGYWKYPEKAQY